MEPFQISCWADKKVTSALQVSLDPNLPLPPVTSWIWGGSGHENFLMDVPKPKEGEKVIKGLEEKEGTLG